MTDLAQEVTECPEKFLERLEQIVNDLLVALEITRDAL